MASVLVYHVVGDLTLGKPEHVEFLETETLESAIKAIGESSEGGISVWKRKSQTGLIENFEMRQQRFVGILNSMDIVAFLAKETCLDDREKALKTPVSEVVMQNNSLLKEVDPATRLIDALEMMKQGVKRLLVAKSVVWKGVSKRFSILYNGKWLKNLNTSNASAATDSRPSASSTNDKKFCCLSREDVIRFLIGCLGALAPIPLASIATLGAITPHYFYIHTSSPAIDAVKKLPQESNTVAVIEDSSDKEHKIIGEISATKLWKCEYLAAALALANLSAGQFVMGIEDDVTPTSLPEFSMSPTVRDGGGSRPRKLSSRNIGFFSNPTSPTFSPIRSIYRGRSTPLTCRETSSLAAVMAQMLSHRATHVWVTATDSEDVLVGVVSYTDILFAVTKHPSSVFVASP